jgi:GNAT superfamily N-acetyltransferase
MKEVLRYYRLIGAEARPYLSEMSALRLSIFIDFPYLYKGTLEYEKQYLETYFKSNRSMIFLVQDQRTQQFVGMTTCIIASDEEESLQKIFPQFGMIPQQVLYLGESLLLPAYRGQGIGKKYFEVREQFGQQIGIKTFAFCSVIRPVDHLLRPSNYQDLAPFWRAQGYAPVPNMVAQYRWRDVGEEEESAKSMQYWIKKVG